MSKKEASIGPTCPYCGRSDFKSSKGYQQHLSRNQQCYNAHQNEITTNQSQREEEHLEWTKKIMQDNAKRAALSEIADLLQKQCGIELTHDQDTMATTAFACPLAPIFEQEAETGVLEDGDEDPNFENHFDEEDDEEEEVHQEVFDPNAQDYSESTEGKEEEDHNGIQTGPSTAGRDDFFAFCKENRFVAPLTRAEECGIRLMDVLRKKKAPINAYNKLMEWHLREREVLSDDQMLNDVGLSHYVGRNTLLKRLAIRYNQLDKGPNEKTVKLPSSKEVVRIPVFDAEHKIVELLTDPRLEASDFDFFDDDPLARPPDDQEYIGNMTTGTGFRDTYKAIIDQKNQQLLGTPFYIDGAVTGQFSDLPVTAVKFSLSCFTRKARLKAHTWATLGYLPEVKVAVSRGKKILIESGHLEAEDIDMFDGEGEEIDIDGEASVDSDDGLTEIKAQDFHFMLQVILEPMIELQETGMMWDLVHNAGAYGIHFKLYVPMVRCDTEEADALCGKYKPRTRNVKQICRQCEVPTLQASDPQANYPVKTQTKIQKLVQGGKLGKLKDMSQHHLRNAWYKCRFNQGNDRGIHGACPSEMLHAMQLGIFKYTRDIFFQNIGENAQIAHDINGLARVFGKLLSHQSDRTLPNTNFSKGIKDGKLMAKDYRGVLLVMGAVIRSTKGREMLATKRNFRQDNQKDDWLLLVELLLEWEAFLCLPKMKMKHVKRLDKKHRYIMYIMRQVANRTKGMGLNIMKFHAIVHLMEDIIIHGVPLEFDTAANESHHKESKVAAKLTQRNEANFHHQVAIRMWEFHLIDLALVELETGRRNSEYFDAVSDKLADEMDVSTDGSEQSNRTDGQPVENVTDDAKILVYWNEKDGALGFHLQSRSKHADQTSMNAHLLGFLMNLQDLLGDHLDDRFLDIYTRHKRGDVIFHAHPNYRGQGPWKDWAMVEWAGWGRLPCHISCFVVLDCLPASRNGPEYGGVTLKNTTYAVVESCEWEVNEQEIGRSDLFVPLLKEIGELDADGNVQDRIFYLAEVDAIVSPLAVIPDIGGPPNRYFYIKSRNDWANEFIAWVERPHHEDDMIEEEDNGD